MGNVCPSRNRDDPGEPVVVLAREFPTSRELTPPPEQGEKAKGSGREALRQYVTHTLKRLEGVNPEHEELSEKIEPSIEANLKRLSGGAPAAFRTNIKKALEDNKVLPDHKADKSELVAALEKVLEVISGAGAPPAPTPHVSLAPTPTPDEIGSFAKVVARLWAIDEPHRLRAGTDFKLCHQARAGSHESFNSRSRDAGEGDAAAKPLFEGVNTKKMLANPCTKAFMSLLDNYSLDSSKAEYVSSQERHEMDNFMHCLMGTPHMHYIHQVLIEWKQADDDYSKFATEIFKIWFTLLGKGRGPKSSSGFEHVFVGESDDQKGEISGLHNWIQFFREESKGNLNYKGYVGAINHDDEYLVKVRFDWHKEEKNTSTILVGSSIAFEFAMMSCAFLGFGGECQTRGIWFGNDVGPVTITTYPWDTSMGKVIRSAFCEA